MDEFILVLFRLPFFPVINLKFIAQTIGLVGKKKMRRKIGET